MCGICGVVQPGADAGALRKRVEAMSATLVHRGPDGDGVALREGLALAHRRLSIIDLGGGGAQPMEDSRGYLLTYNGELYNYRQLRRELERQGERFVTHSDTEVVLKSYIRWGEGCLDRFNGMYAFAVHDARDGSLFLARDRIGIKPLYFAECDGGLRFASEIKALLADPDIGREPDLSLFPYYLGYGYFPRQYTAFRHVRQLRPGHWMRRHRDGRLEQRCYWDPAERVEADAGRRVDGEALEALGALIAEAVEMQTVADVPVGTFLSGGLDSGIVTALLARGSDDAVKSFTVGMGDPTMDESALARLVAERYRTDHHQLSVAADDLLAHWEGLLEHFDQPFADTSALPTYLVSRFAREHVKVALSGDGGDEQWGGYGNYRRYLQLRELRRLLPGPLAHAGAALAAGGAALIAGARPRLGRRLRYYSGLLDADAATLHGTLDRHIDALTLEGLAGERLRPHLGGEHSPEALTRRDPRLHLDGVMLGDLGQFMVDDVLRKVDMMSMAVSLEVRVPLLDHRVVERSLALSWRDKVSRSETKLLGRRLAEGLLPRQVLDGGKRGFGVPLDGWFRGPLREMANDILGGRGCRERGVLEPRAVRRLLADHAAGRADNGKALVTLLSLERWFERYEEAG